MGQGVNGGGRKGASPPRRAREAPWRDQPSSVPASLPPPPPGYKQIALTCRRGAAGERAWGKPRLQGAPAPPVGRPRASGPARRRLPRGHLHAPPAPPALPRCDRPAPHRGSGSWSRVGGASPPQVRHPTRDRCRRRRALCLCGRSEGYGSSRGALAPPAAGAEPRSGAKAESLRYAAILGPAVLHSALRFLPPTASPTLHPSPTPARPASPALRSPALRDPRAAAHGRSEAESEHHARPGVGAQLAPRRLQEGLACGALPCAPGGGPRCRQREEGERELGGGDWAGGGAGRASAAAPEAALAPLTETQARRRPCVGVHISVHTSVHACTRAHNGRVVAACQSPRPVELGLVILTPRLL